MYLTPTAQLARALIQRPSVTPDDAGCQVLLAQRLHTLGFQCHHLRFEQVNNLWATRRAAIHAPQSPVVVFAGHTDVVPSGPEQDWQHPPFSGAVENGYLYGRGAEDMKGGIAAFMTACERFIDCYPNHSGTIGWLLTSDEEGPARFGTQAVMQTLQENSQSIDYCIVGEPTSHQKIGDTIKLGRRGSLNGHLTVFGKQGHIAYPQLADNPLHRILPALNQLDHEVWDNGNENFDPTRFQISNIHGGTLATNVTPGKVEVIFNFRYSPESTASRLQQRTESILTAHELDYSIDWDLSGQPFATECGHFTELVSQSIEETTGYKPRFSTSGGTSDGRFIAPSGTQVIELGAVNKTLHQVNECVSLSDLDLLSACYEKILGKLLC